MVVLTLKLICETVREGLVQNDLFPVTYIIVTLI